MDITLLWFQCKNPDCDYTPIKTKKDKVKRYWRYGLSLDKSKRQRLFMRYVEGSYLYREHGQMILFESKLYGTILLYNGIRDYEDMPTNSYVWPILDKELCNPCINKIQNERLLLG